MERKLASIQKIKSIVPIDGADKIELATVLGWQVVVKKGDFKVDDLCVYCEVDSQLPEIPEFEFLRDRKFRIKTIKLRKVISQGIVFPISVLENFGYKSIKNPVIFEGEDITGYMDIKKYETPEEKNNNGTSISRSNKMKFPPFIHKTDETRIQSIPWVLEEYKDEPFVGTLKMDGSSMTVYLNNFKFGVCSRNLQIKKNPDDKFWNAVIKNDLENKMRGHLGQKETNIFSVFFRKILNKFVFSKLSYPSMINLAIQGELVGEGIQSNRHHLNTTEFFVFRIFDIDSKTYYSPGIMREFCNQLGLKMCPVIYNDYKLPDTIDKIVNDVIIPSPLYETYKEHNIFNEELMKKDNHNHVEGIVFKPKNPKYHPKLGNVSFKVINPEYLLKHGL
jgi:hypothetical protein